jgi:hypothetical protein
MKRKGIFFFILCFISVFLFTQNPGDEKRLSRSLLGKAPPGLKSFHESGRDVKTKGRLFQAPRSFFTSSTRTKKNYEAGVLAKEAQITGLSCVQIGPTGGNVVAAEIHNNNLYALTKGYPSKLFLLENNEWKQVLLINERCYGLHINNNGAICIPGISKLYVLRSGETSPTSISYPEGFAITTSETEEYAPYRIDSSRSDPNDVWVAGEKDSQASVARLDVSTAIIHGYTLLWIMELTGLIVLYHLVQEMYGELDITNMDVYFFLTMVFMILSIEALAGIPLVISRHLFGQIPMIRTTLSVPVLGLL